MKTKFENLSNGILKEYIFIGCIFWVTFFYHTYFLQQVYSKLGYFHNSDFLLYTMCGKDAFSGNLVLNNWFGCTNTFYLLSLIYGLFGKVIGYDYRLILIVTPLLFSMITSLVAYIALKKQEEESSLKYLKVVFIVSLIYASCYMRNYGIYAGAHMDATLISIYLYVLIDAQLRTKKRYLIGFILSYCLFFLGALSDSLTVFFTLIPVFMVLIGNIVLLKSDKIIRKYLSIHLGIIILLSTLSRYALDLLGIKIPWDGKIMTTSGAEVFARIGFTVEEIFYLFGANVFSAELSADLIPSIISACIVFLLIVVLIIQSKNWINDILNQLCLAVVVFLILTLIFTEYSPFEEGVDYPTRMLYPLFFGILILFSNIDFNKALESIKVEKKIMKHILLLVSILTLFVSFNNISAYEEKEEGKSEKYLKIAEALKNEGLNTGFANFPNSFPVMMESDYSINITSVSSYPTAFFPVNNKKPVDLKYADFIIFDDEDDWGGLTEKSIRDTVGKPDKVIDFGKTHIYIWNKNIVPYIYGLDFPVRIFRSDILSYLGKARKESEYLNLSKEAVVCGPSVYMKEGKYRIIYYGENLGEAVAHLYSYYMDIHKLPLTYHVIEQGEDKIVMEADLDKEITDMEFRLRNASAGSVKLRHIQSEYLGE